MPDPDRRSPWLEYLLAAIALAMVLAAGFFTLRG